MANDGVTSDHWRTCLVWYGPAILSGLAVPGAVLSMATGFDVCEVPAMAMALMSPLTLALSILAPRQVRASHRAAFRLALTGGLIAIVWCALSLAAFSRGIGPIQRFLEFFLGDAVSQ